MSEQTFRLLLKSTYEESEKVPDFVTDIQERSNIDDDTTGTLMLLLSEAVTNAIVHGNKLNPSKTVDVEVRINQKQIVSTVKDQGEGFEPEEADNPLDEENILKASGRGIFLMKQMSEHVEYDENGTKLRFILKR
ncbi:MAG: ATP-binding protein [Balneolaceae bacterium]|nr:MAG: ATP-binding protein [Balneolaceae bacterium]